MVYYISRKIDLERRLNLILNKLIAIKIGVISSLLIIFVCLLNLIDYYLGYTGNNSEFITILGSCFLALIISHIWDYLLLNKHNNKQDRQIKNLDRRVTTIEKIIKGFK